MNKIICDVCGTSYPENSSQCPICGFARSSEPDNEFGAEQSTYTYVKGGRFSKSNVRKRNQANQKRVSDEPVQRTKPAKQKEEKSNTGLVIVIIVLLLAIIAVVGYIAVRFFLPDNAIGDLFSGISASQSTDDTQDTAEDQIDDTPQTVPCQTIVLDQYQLELTVDSDYQLTASVEPVDTTDVLQFTSSDSSVATVDASGLVTAYAEGSTVINVTCGTASAECTVVCVAPTTEPIITEPPTEEAQQVSIELNRKEITFDIEGQTWMLYDGPVALADIVWSSDDNAVATIQDGKVKAVGNGDTTVYASYNGVTVSCAIHCKLDTESSSSSNISEAGGESKRTYKLYNPTGYADDVTIKVGEKFTLKLVDENKKEVTGATWEVGNSKYCSYKDNTVKGLAAGTTEVTATYEGVTYTCLVRVIKK